MNNPNQSENIFPNKPSDFDPNTNTAELANARYAVGLSAGVLALASSLSVFSLAPTALDAHRAGEISLVVENAGTMAILAGMSYICIKNIQAYGVRWKQALVNKQLLQIEKENGLE